ncbi:hypothetical protein [Oceanobacillus caeni]|nr:hypothetical protein [Oceanobacillus caeni]
MNKGLLTTERKEEMVKQFEEEIEKAVKDFEGTPLPPAHETFDYVYEKPHPQLLKQREEFKNRLER